MARRVLIAMNCGAQEKGSGSELLLIGINEQNGIGLWPVQLHVAGMMSSWLLMVYPGVAIAGIRTACPDSDGFDSSRY